MTTFYRQGAIGGFLDEYERAIADLQIVVAKIPDQELLIVVDPKTKDEESRTFQAILSHVVYAAYGYATSIHNLKGAQTQRPVKVFHSNTQLYLDDLVNIFSYTESVFSRIEEFDLEPSGNSLIIKSNWGPLYNIEQMMEHAIVHILRHRRQIERLMA